jgi:hypothetical protein
MFFCRAASSLSASPFWRSISFWGAACFSRFSDSAVAASAFISRLFENTLSSKEFRLSERERSTEVLESSQRAMAVSFGAYSSFVGSWISG